MKYSEWIVPRETAEIPSQLVDAGFPPLLSSLLLKRGISSPSEAREYLLGDIGLLSDPMLLADMDKAAARLTLAIERRENVAVFGDYDVDGITSACLVSSWLRSKGVPCVEYIPDRIEEGYGLNIAAIDTIAKQGATLIVTVDCGITAVDEVAYAVGLGIDMVITDHHECAACLPCACAVVDPKRPDCRYPNQALAGVGVAFKLLCAVEGDAERVLSQYADLVATGTVSDVMPLTGENRYLVRRGLDQMSSAPRPGIRALLNEAGNGERKLTSSTIGFMLAPRLNAAGRLGRADVAVHLLMTDDPAQASRLASQLCQLNRERQTIEQSIWEQARGMLKGQAPQSPIVLAAENWHQGVIGIAASKLSEEFSMPSVMICLDGNMGKGSCRSHGGFNLFDALTYCSEYLEGFGGHALAAGLTIRREKVDGFRAALAEYYRDNPPPAYASALCCDLCVNDPDMLSMENTSSLELLEPHGSGNPRPTLCLTDAVLENLTPIGGGRHLRFSVRKGSRSFECVMFARTRKELGVSDADAVDVAFYPQINEFRGRRSVQLLVTDVRPADELVMCRRLLEGEPPCEWDAAEHCPSRADFVSLWRWLDRNGGHFAALFSCIREWKPENLSAIRFALCLRVLTDSGLVRFSFSDGELTLDAVKCTEKVDLDSDLFLQELRRCRDKY